MSDTEQADLERKLEDIPRPLRLLARLFANAPVGFQIYRADGHCLLTNRAFRELFGSEPPPEYSVLEDDVAARSGVLGLIRRAFAGEAVSIPTIWYDPRELEQLSIPVGRRVAVSATFFPLFDSEGKVSHVGIAFRDETRERLLLEEAEAGRAPAEAAERRAAFLAAASTALSDARDLERTLRDVAELASASIADWTVVTARIGSGELRRIAVVHRDPAKRAAAEEYLRSFPPHLHRPDLREISEGRRPVLFERLDAKDLARVSQDSRHLEVLESLGVASAILVPLTRGAELIGVLTLVRGAEAPPYGRDDFACAQDFAARLSLALENARLFEASRHAEERLRAVVENLPQLAWTASTDGTIDFYNQRWFEYTGTTLGQMKRDGWQSVLDAEAVPGVARTWARAIDRGEPFELELRLRGADGSYRWFLTRMRLLSDSAGRRLGWVGTHTDIDEQMRQTTELRHAVDTRDTFLSVASHELRTPLTPLMLKLEALEVEAATHSDSPLAPLVLRHTEVMRRQLGRLTSLVNTLLDVSRISSGRMVLEPARFDLAAAVREAAGRFELQAGRQGTLLRVDTPDDLPAFTDRLRVEQIVTNLVDNALKYGAGSPVEVKLRPEGDAAILTVADRGIGIAPENLARIFQRFERAVSDRNYGGLGLGLYIVRTVAEALGGAVSVQSTPGAGSTFTVRLPLGR